MHHSSQPRKGETAKMGHRISGEFSAVDFAEGFVRIF
jgi:hypothetical protein